MSRIPAEKRENRVDDVEKFFISQIKELPVSFTDVQEASGTDDAISKVHSYLMNGWSKCEDDDLKPYFRKRDELAVQGKSIFWGRRIIIPQSLRSVVLDQLHKCHPGMVRMKQLARMYCWWPSINDDIESRVSGCHTCQEHQNSPRKAEVLSWPETEGPWERIHLDYAPNFMGKALLILVDSHSKWVEIGVTGTDQISSRKTIQILKGWFSRFGYPKVIVSDNGTQFSSKEFEEFTKSIGAIQKFSAPGHPATNGLAERMVQTVKKSIKKIFSQQTSRDLNGAVEEFLFSYRCTPHAATSHSPAELLIGRQLRNNLTLLNDVPERRESDHPKADLKLQDEVYIQVKLGSTNNLWKKGFIKKVIGPRHFIVQSEGKFYRRHRNQINRKKK